jgi:penicillin G amidase
MRITDSIRTVEIAGAEVKMRRTTGGVIELWGDSFADLMLGLGFAHAHDRQLQMMLVRLIGQGRLCECLKDTDETLAIDLFMRQMGFARTAQDEVARCSDAALAIGDSYAAGVNAYLARSRRRWEFVLAGFRPEPWTVADTLLTINLMSYVGLAQTQQDMEKFLIQAIHDGVDVARLKKLFAPHLDGLTDEIVELIRRVKIIDRVVPPLPIVPAFTASNNWAVAGHRSQSGFALQCNDPHLECNRLPAVWYEVVMHTPENDYLGITMPGVPGLSMGRSRDVSMGFTYGLMDMVDYFIEECRDGRFRRADGWHDFEIRRDRILRRKHVPVEIAVRENELGALEADPHAATIDDGLYLCRAYSAARRGAAQSLHALAELPFARTAADAQRILGSVSISCNWLIADRQGDIAYQQSGLLPRRRHSGLHPVPAWDRAFAWCGCVPPEELASKFGSPEGFLVTANDDQNQPGKPLSINLCMGRYRTERISELLREHEKLTVADMQRIQRDLVSTQARRYLELLRPLIPPTPAGRILAEWDLRYDKHSFGATLFDMFYTRLLHEVFGARLFGAATWDAVCAATNLAAIFFHRFDDAVLGDDPAWFADESRETMFQRVLDAVTDIPSDRIPPWGARRQVMMHNIFFGGRLPRFLSTLCGIDYGPITLEGSRATIVQGSIFRTHGRVSTFAPSYRYVTDLGSFEAWTALAGGPTDRWGDPSTGMGIEDWLAYRYKLLGVSEGLPRERQSLPTGAD